MPSGRPRDQEARARIIDATFSLALRNRSATIAVDEIAHEAGVGKQTIYRWWASKAQLLLDALLERTVEQTPLPDSPDPRADFLEHICQVATVFSSPVGAVIKELLGDAQADPLLASMFVDRYWNPRRELTAARLRRAIERGDIRADLDPDAFLDTLYGFLWLRLVVGHAPMNERTALDVVTLVWEGAAPKPVTGSTRRPRRSDAS